MRYALLFLILLQIGAATMIGQTLPQEQTSTVDGCVADVTNGHEIAGAIVRLEQYGKKDLIALTDENGCFHFASVPFGSYCMYGQIAGFFPGGGIPAPTILQAHTPCFSASGRQRSIRRNLALVPYASISGRVTEPGVDRPPGSPPAPAARYTVQLLRRRVATSRFGTADLTPAERVAYYRHEQRVGPGDDELEVVAGTRTNDQGRYLFERLQTGMYYVVVLPGESCRGRPLLCDGSDAGKTLRSTFYPHSLDFAGAVPIQVGVGKDVEKIDVEFIRQAGLRIGGRLTRSSTFPYRFSDFEIWLWPEDQTDEKQPAPHTRIEKLDTPFVMTNVLRGRYVLEAYAYAWSGDAVWRVMSGSRAIDVRTEDLDDLEIPIFERADVAGEVQFEMNCPPVQISIEPRTIAQGSAAAMYPILIAHSDTHGKFFMGLEPGKYVLGVFPTPDAVGNYPSSEFEYIVSSARFGEMDVLHDGLSVSGAVSQPPSTLQITMGCTKARQ